MRMRFCATVVFATFMAVPPSILAQWPLYSEAGAPRTADGKVELDAPMPRTADGKPALSGVWQIEFVCGENEKSSQHYRK